MAKKRVVVGLSGGVDSSVAALLLLEQGYEVHGVFMKNWEDSFAPGYCSAADDVQDAEDVCQTLGIALHKVNFSDQYRTRVFTHFLREYESGRTPNPDILCNKEIKFSAFLEHSQRLGADYLATGHYARLQHNGSSQLLKAQDQNKDQSYFLHALNQQQLRNTLFPLGEFDKQAVRQIAEQADLITHNKKDSTGICFIGERDFRQFLGHFLAPKPGPMQTPEGEVVAQHDGLMFYTLGQRQGLGLGGRSGANNEPWYVVDKIVESNTLIVSQGEHSLLYRQRLRASQVHWIAETSPDFPLHCSAKTRYRQNDQACTVHDLGEGVCEVNFAQTQRAITPGQSVVFYDDERCLGGAIIDAAYN